MGGLWHCFTHSYLVVVELRSSDHNSQGSKHFKMPQLAVFLEPVPQSKKKEELVHPFHMPLLITHKQGRAYNALVLDMLIWFMYFGDPQK